MLCASQLTTGRVPKNRERRRKTQPPKADPFPVQSTGTQTARTAIPGEQRAGTGLGMTPRKASRGLPHFGSSEQQAQHVVPLPINNEPGAEETRTAAAEGTTLKSRSLPGTKHRDANSAHRHSRRTTCRDWARDDTVGEQRLLPCVTLPGLSSVQDLLPFRLQLRAAENSSSESDS
jgi:hypothetical protein